MEYIMANYQAAVSGNAIKNNGGTVVKAGNVSSTATHVTNSQTLMENAVRDGNSRYGTRPALASSPLSSGNIGTYKPLSGGTYAYNPPSKVSSSSALTVVAKKLSSTISGAAQTQLLSGGADVALRKARHPYQGNRLLDISSWNAVTGAASYGANRGVLMSPSGIDNVTGPNADSTILNATFAIPGELVYMKTGATPTQDDYAAKYSP